MRVNIIFADFLPNDDSDIIFQSNNSNNIPIKLIISSLKRIHSK